LRILLPGEIGMALTSPGVQVTVIDESFYTPAEPGTTPLIVVATAENKKNAAGTAIASGTIASNVANVYKLTSQKDLVDTFGVPFFETTASGSPIHGSERNEYGLLAAYSYLSASNSAFIVRADLDLNQLVPAATAPGALPDDGKWWVDTANTQWGIQEWNSAAISAGGQKFTYVTPLVLTDDDAIKVSSGAPKGSVGSIGDYAVVFQTVMGADSAYAENARIFYKSAGNAGAGINAGQWVQVGSPDWASSQPAVVGSTVTVLDAAETFHINGTLVTVPSGASVTARLAALANAINTPLVTGVSAKVSNGKLYLFTNGTSSIVITGGTTNTLTHLGITAGTYLAPKLVHSPHTSVPTFKRADNPSSVTGVPSGSVWIKTTEPGNGARWRVKRYNLATKSWVAYSAPIYKNGTDALYFLDRTGGGINIAKDAIYVQSNAGGDNPQTAEFRVWRRSATGYTIITSSAIADSTFTAGSKTINLAESLIGGDDSSLGTDITFTLAGTANDSVTIATAINAVGFSEIEASVTAANELQIFHKTGGDITLNGSFVSHLFTPIDVMAGTGTPNFYANSDGSWTASIWAPLAMSDFAAAPHAPLNEPDDNQLWYNNAFGEVDIMVHNGTTWKGYRTVFAGTDPAGPQISATKPTTQSNGNALVTGDLWISTADMENFPTIYRYNYELSGVAAPNRWVLVDKTDQTSEEGILFADARYGLSGVNGNTEASIADLLSSNFLDFDAPDPALYPKGMLLWNLRRSGGNVKKYRKGYVDVTADNLRYNGESMEAYAVNRWTTASPNNEDGSGSFGRKAQRSVVVAAMKSAIDTNTQIRDEERRNFNLIAAPGYTEVYSNLVNLNIDRGLTAFVVGDTPLRLQSDATTLINWGTNAAGVTDNGDKGVVTYDEYSALYYPNGFTTDLGGHNAVVPASHMMLKTIALSDAVSYPWFAPAGTRRGGITNATSVGYIDGITGEFQTVALNEGLRDVLYDLKINPIPFFVGVGHVAFGQKTRGKNASALDRINVARLVVYLRSQLNKLARPYIFEPNDKITRDEIKGAVESLLLELVGLRAIYDFAVVCDTSNNTNARIDRNELYVDIAITPVKAVEFIYIPLRVKNTGAI